MNYFISEKICDLEVEIVGVYDDELIKYLMGEFRFKNNDFEEFFLILQFSVKEDMGVVFGKDRLQVSKKEKALFLGVNLANEEFEKGNFPSQLKYIFERVEEVKKENRIKLLKLGMIENSSTSK